MKNSNNQNAMDLQSMMFEQMKRLSDPNADLEIEIKRSMALSSAGTVIINAEKVKIDSKRVALQESKEKPSKVKRLTNG